MAGSFHDKVVYQIYPKSFCDTTGSGEGDLKGVTSKLDYLKDLGVDLLWLTPFFCSPQRDNGYDVSDYYRIAPQYGTMEELEELICEARKRDMGLMLDMVFNHTSTEHEWFQRAMRGERKYKDYYIFRKSTREGMPPTNWVSKFGGSAWEYVPDFDEYYLHLFDVSQADLNWDNPRVREELVKVLKFWKEKGICGFRFDVVNLISKPEVFVDDQEGDGRRFYTDGPHVHEYLKEMTKEAGIEDYVTVGEMSSTSIDNCIRYSSPGERELSMTFNFHHLKVDYKDQDKWKLMPCDFGRLRELLNTWQVEMTKGGGWNALFWSNHDQPRILSRFGRDAGSLRKPSAKMLAMLMYLQRGTPYIYQGEELGMTNAGFRELSQYRDVESINYYHILKEQGMPEDEIYEVLRRRSRDNSRTPMQWNAGKNAGFSEGTPWIAVNENYGQINAACQAAEEDSILNFYKKWIAVRKEYPVLREGDFRPILTEYDGIYAYVREYEGSRALVMANFFEKEAEVVLPKEVWGEAQTVSLLYNYEPRKLEGKMTLKPYEALLFVIE